MSDETATGDTPTARYLTEEQVQRLRDTRGLTDEVLKALPDHALRRVLQKLEFADLAQARNNFRLRQESGGTLRIPTNATLRALRDLDSARVRATPVPLTAGMPTGTEVTPEGMTASDTAGLTGRRWVALGPGNVGGRVRSIVVHPTSPDVLWAGSVGGGVWRTGNAGVSWLPVDDFLANLAVTTMVMDPTNPQVLYAGTGEGFYNGDALRGAGVFRTTDGTRWTHLPKTAGADFQWVNRLAISRDGRVLLAATRNGIFRSEDADRQSWVKVLAGEMGTVAFSPTNGSRAVAAGVNSGKAFFSTDGGRTWTQSTPVGQWGGRVELAYAAGDSSMVYASVDADGGQIWRSTDGGRTYTQRAGLGTDGKKVKYLGNQGWYDHVIWAGDRSNTSLVLVGGIDLWRSTDGGDRLADISTWWDNRSAHADQHCIVTDPRFGQGGNRRIYVGNDGGVFTTPDVSTVGNDTKPPRIRGWKELVNAFPVTQFFGGAGNPTTGTIIGGAQDNGTLRFTPNGGTEGWTSMFGGDGGHCAADPTDPRSVSGEYVYLNVHRSTDGGATAEYISGQFFNQQTQQWDWKPVPYQIEDARFQRALFIAPFVLDPNQPRRLLAGGRSLWRTEDAKAANTVGRGPVWRTIKPPAAGNISAIAVAKGNSDLVWVAHETGDVYVTTNGTAASPAWRKVSGAGAGSLNVPRFCTRLVIDPSSAGRTVYATFGGYNRDNVWKTTDGGTTWRSIGAGLPEAPVRALAIHPDRPLFIYVGTEVGVFASEDGGSTWSPTNEGPTNCSVDHLFWMNRTLVSVTHGRGMFQIDLAGI
jgi:hypothetical protein